MSANEGVPPHSAVAAVAREGLSRMRLRALYKRAEELGVDETRLDAAEDADDVKAGIIDLIVAAEAHAARAAGNSAAPAPESTAASSEAESSAVRVSLSDTLTTPGVEHALGRPNIAKKAAQVRASLEAVPDIFSELAGEGQLLRFPDFKEALVERLQISLSEHEIERVWSRIVADRPATLPDGASILDAQLTLKEFSRGVEHVSFLRCCVQSLRQGAGDFSVPADYDYNKSTNDNYGVADATANFVGEYVKIRQSRDYSYHTHYTLERQHWQDHAIKTVVSRTERQGNPWIVYTCGPMGAGKGYVLSWMSRNGYFPLEDIVCIDPDHFKKMMPEWQHYTAKGNDAGTLCHRESGFLQEIAQEVAMNHSQNVWVDGSLRDGAWFALVFKSIRRRFPHYKIAIFEVSASEEVVRERIKQRAQREGRDIPEHLITQSLASVAGSLNILMPLVDFVARIDNGGPSPHLRAYIRINPDGNWSHIQRRFARPERAGSFPGALAPLRLRPVPDPSSLLQQPRDTSSGQLEHLELDLRSSALDSIRDAIREAKITLSPGCTVTLRGSARTLAGIPTEATWFAFAYPVSMDWNKIPDQTQYNCQSLVAMAGGFVYFDLAGAVCGANAVTSFMDDDEEPPEEGVVRQESVLLEPLLQFCPPVPLPEAAYNALASSDRWRPVTIASLIAKGAYAFAWIKPGEQLDGLVEVPVAGAFAYVFHSSKLQAALDPSLLEEDDSSTSVSGTSKATGFANYFCSAKHEGCYFPVAV